MKGDLKIYQALGLDSTDLDVTFQPGSGEEFVFLVSDVRNYNGLTRSTHANAAKIVLFDGSTEGPPIHYVGSNLDEINSIAKIMVTGTYTVRIKAPTAGGNFNGANIYLMGIQTKG